MVVLLHEVEGEVPRDADRDRVTEGGGFAGGDAGELGYEIVHRTGSPEPSTSVAEAEREFYRSFAAIPS